MYWRLAVRNIRRNAWRSGLTVAGIAVSVGLLVWMHAYLDGMLEELVEGATAVDVGQVQVHRTDWGDKPRVDRAFVPHKEWLERLSAAPGVKGVVPRLEFWGLLGNDERSEVTRFIGVEPDRAQRHTPIADAVIAGEWLPTGDKSNASGAEIGADETESGGVTPSPVVVGAGLAKRIDVEVGDELVVFAEASDGSLGNDLLVVRGLVRTGKTSIDRRGAFLTLEEAQFVAALEGQIHELQITTEQVRQAGEVASEVRKVVPESVEMPSGSTALSVTSWRESNPQLANMIDMSGGSMWSMYAIVYLLAALGIVNAQRMSALERRREFGVMQAVGMTPRIMFGIVMLETVVLSMMGSIAGAALGGSVAWYHATQGLNLGAFSDLEQFSYLGVTITERIYFVLSVEAFVWPMGILVVLGVICGLWPAAWAAGIDPARVMAGRD